MKLRKIVYILIALVVIAGLIFYFYNFYVFKEFSGCITNETQRLPSECQTNNDCVNFLLKEYRNQTSQIPEVIRERWISIIKNATYCENSTCYMKKITGAGFNGKETISEEECNSGERFIIKLYGKDVIRIIPELKKTMYKKE